MSKHLKLHIPGPVEVSPVICEAMQQPMIGHRGEKFRQLYTELQSPLQTLFATQQPVFLSTSSSWGLMEGALRNLVSKKVLTCCSGAFSDKWYDVALRCGKEAEKLAVEWGQPILPEMVEEKLSTGTFDAITLVHNETSTGVLNPLEDIAKVVRQYEEICFIVDTVSSFSALPTPVDAWGIDWMLTGSQKALALPPGFSLFVASARALERAKSVEGRGFYFDLLEFQKNHDQKGTPTTPSLPHLYALQAKLEEIFQEGIERRYARHSQTNAMVHAWVEGNGFAFFAPEGYRSKTLTCIQNNRCLDLPRLIALLEERWAITIDGGYGKIKGKTFRLSNMGDETEESIAYLLEALNEGMRLLRA